MIYDPQKFRCYMMAARMRGFAEGLEDKYKHEALINMLNEAANLLEYTWHEYLDEVEEE